MNKGSMNITPQLARMGLIYQELVCAVIEVYERWGVQCDQDEVRRLLNPGGHRDILIRREVQIVVESSPGEKMGVIHREVGDEYSVSEHAVRKAVSSRSTGPVRE